MAQEINLHGGPYHGGVVSIPDGHDHFHIVGLKPGAPEFREDQPTSPEAVGTREGTYSRVFGHPTDFEWDGWTSKHE